MNGQYMRSTPDEALLAVFLDTLPYLPGGEALAAQIDDAKRAQLLRSMAGLKERAKTLVELADGAQFLFAQRPLAYDAKATEILKPEGKAHLAALAPKLAALPDWTAHAAEEVVRAYVAETGAKLGQVAQPLRAALTGRGDLAGHIRRSRSARPRGESWGASTMRRLEPPPLAPHWFKVRHLARCTQLSYSGRRTIDAALPSSPSPISHGEQGTPGALPERQTRLG